MINSGSLLRWSLFLFCLIILFFGIRKQIRQSKNVEMPLPEGWTNYPYEDDIFDIAIQDTIIWIGGKRGVKGMHFQSGEIIQEIVGEVKIEYARSLLIDKKGILWIAHQNGLTSYDGNTTLTFTEQDGVPDKRVNFVYLDNQQQLWIGSWGGAARKKKEGWEIFNKESGLLEDMVNVIYQDAFGGMWFGSYVAPKGGLSILDKDGYWQYFSTKNGLPHNNITAIHSNSGDEVWMGMGLLDRGGAVRFSRKNSHWAINKVLAKEDGLAGEKVRSLHIDERDRIWLGFEYDGITILEKNLSKKIILQKGLIHQEIKGFQKDSHGNFWIVSRRGLTKITPILFERF